MPAMSDEKPQNETPAETEGAEPNAAGSLDDPTTDDKTMAMLGHLLGIVSLFVGPLIIWLIKKDKSAFVDDQGKEALNFQMGMTAAFIVSAVIGCIPIVQIISCVLWPALFVVNVVFCILAGLAANKGEPYRYPVAIRLIK
jgi:uncharacterized Tic20 family protein